VKHSCTMIDIVREGAIVVAELDVDRARRQMLTLKGEFPPRRTVRLMVDTGAELSFVDQAVAVDLGAAPLLSCRAPLLARPLGWPSSPNPFSRR
jgi:hypothetical protein